MSLHTVGYASTTSVEAKAKRISIIIEDQLTETETYMIKDASYMKLKDASELLNKTDMSFDITWDSQTNETELIVGGKYESGSSEEDYNHTKSKRAIASQSVFLVDGEKHTLNCYLIDNSKYIMLRDLIPIIGGKLSWEEETSTVQISSLNSDKKHESVDLGQNKSDNKLYATNYTLYIGQNPFKGVYKIGDRLYYSFEHLSGNRNYTNLVYTTHRSQDDVFESLSINPDVLKHQTSVLASPESFIEHPYMGIVKPFKRYLEVEKRFSEKVFIKNALYLLDDYMLLIDLKALETITDLRYDHDNKAIYMFEDVQAKASVKIEEDYVNKALKSINLQGKTNPQKVEIIHDYLVANLEYSYYYPTNMSKENIAICEKLNHPNNKTLVSKVAICEDYAGLFYEMLTRVGIPTTYQFGGVGDEPHVWNRVYFKDKWRTIDVTWDDPVSTSKNSKTISREYFDVSLEKLYRTHFWSHKDYIMPEYDSSWQSFINQTADTPDKFRKIMIANLKNNNENFIIKVKNSSAYGGGGFITHYSSNGDIDCYSMSVKYDEKAKGYRVRAQY